MFSLKPYLNRPDSTIFKYTKMKKAGFASWYRSSSMLQKVESIQKEISELMVILHGSGISYRVELPATKQMTFEVKTYFSATNTVRRPKLLLRPFATV